MPLPEERVSDALCDDPGPVLVAPPFRSAVAAGVDEFQKIGIRDVVPIDRKRLDGCDALRKFVIPAEWDRIAVNAKRGASTRNLDPFARRNSSGVRAGPPQPAHE